MAEVLTFLDQLKEVVIKIFDLVDLVMYNVDKYTKEDAE